VSYYWFLEGRHRRSRNQSPCLPRFHSNLSALNDAHGNERNHAFRLKLIRDPRFAQTVNDIVIEVGNARFQAVADRFVRGEDVPIVALRDAWREISVPTAGNNYGMAQELFQTVREVNASQPRERQIRILLGDPPIDWQGVRTQEEHRSWIALRDSFPAALIQVEVLAKKRRALVLYGQLHFQRKSIFTNYEMTSWQAHTLVSLVETATPTRVFTIWELDPIAQMQPDISMWPIPSLSIIRGTALGRVDFSVYRTVPGRVAVKDGKMVQVPKDQWGSLRAEDQLDAVLYLGPSGSTRVRPSHEIPPELCSEPGFLEMQLSRIALTGVPSFEAENLKKYCAGVTTSTK
jgi:hypothetical protein